MFESCGIRSTRAVRNDPGLSPPLHSRRNECLYSPVTTGYSKKHEATTVCHNLFLADT